MKNIQSAFELIKDERQRQFEKWGVQTHDPFTWLAILTEEVGEVSQSALHDRFGGKAAGTLKEELVQVAAVAVQWLEQIVEDEALFHSIDYNLMLSLKDITKQHR